jgi:hypothetical protein
MSVHLKNHFSIKMVSGRGELTLKVVRHILFQCVSVHYNSALAEVQIKLYPVFLTVVFWV